jgi:hypothetical protein
MARTARPKPLLYRLYATLHKRVRRSGRRIDYMTAFSEALYYPWIDIKDETWLKTAFLYWDSVQTIVPTSIHSPYSSRTARAFQDAGFLVPLRVHSDMEQVKNLTDDVATYLGTSEGAELLAPTVADYLFPFDRYKRRARKMSGELTETFVHHHKLSRESRKMVTAAMGDGDWVSTNEKFAAFYMTLLAQRLAESAELALLTPMSAAEKLAIKTRLGTAPPAQRMSQGLLAQLSIERVGVDADTTVDQLLKFRETHGDQLAMFRTKVAGLTSAVGEDLPAEALRQRLSDIYKNEVVPAVSGLKGALAGQRIKAVGEGLLKTAFFSAGSSALLTAVGGVGIGPALIVGAGVSLTVSVINYRTQRAESLRANPYSYLLSLKRELG